MNRKLSFLTVAIVYVIAAVVGILLYNTMTFENWINILIADVVATLVIYVFGVIFGNASMYDPYWSVQPLVIVYAFMTECDYIAPVVVLQLIAITYWGVRLTANWAYTFHGLKYQDWRYTMLRQKTGRLYPIVNLLGIHMFPTLVVYLCTIPIVITMALSGPPSVGMTETVPWLSIVGFVISILATTLQCVSDIQMHRFRRSGVGGFIRTGLWKHSRHPNYLGEILMWWGIALTGIGATGMGIFVGGALVNTIMFFVISIPMQDRRQSQKEGFSSYKASTRMLLPIPKRNHAGHPF